MTLTPLILRFALAELSLSHLWVLYPGKETYPLARNVTVIPLENLDKIKISDEALRLE